MKREHENIDRYFKDALGHFKATPDDAVWEKISRQLARKRRPAALFIITRMAAGIALLAALGLVLRFITREQDRNRPAYENITATEQAPVPEQPDTSTSTSLLLADSVEGQHATGLFPDERGPAAMLRSENQVQPGYIEPPDQENLLGQTDMAGQKSLTNPSRATGQETMDITLLRDLNPHTGIPLQAVDGLKAGNLPVVNGEDMFYDMRAERQVEAIEQADLSMALESPSSLKKPSRKSWVLGGELGPLYTYRHIASDDLDDHHLYELNEAENGMLAYAGGIRVSYSPTGRFSIQSGISYSRYGQEKEIVTQYSYNNAATDQFEQNIGGLEDISITNSTGFIAASQDSRNSDDFLVFSSGPLSYDNLENISAVQYFDFLEIPLIFRYKLVDRKVDFRLVGGMLTSLLIGNQVYLKKDDDSRYYGKTLNIRSVNYVGTIGLGIEYPFTGDFNVNIEPRFGYTLNSFDKTSEIKVHPYSFGIFTGVSYRF